MWSARLAASGSGSSASSSLSTTAGKPPLLERGSSGVRDWYDYWQTPPAVSSQLSASQSQLSSLLLLSHSRRSQS